MNKKLNYNSKVSKKAIHVLYFYEGKRCLRLYFSWIPVEIPFLLKKILFIFRAHQPLQQDQL